MAQTGSSSHAHDDAGLSLVVCRVASRRCALPLAHVVETMRPLPIQRISGAPEFVLGLSTIRGLATPVVDLERLLGDSGSAPGRFVVIRAEERRIALAVDTVVGVHALPPGSRTELPPLLQDVAAIAKIATLDAEMLFVLRSVRLVPDTTWAVLDSLEGKS